MARTAVRARSEDDRVNQNIKTTKVLNETSMSMSDGGGRKRRRVVLGSDAFEVKHKPGEGRVMVATRSFSIGDVIMREEPLLVWGAAVGQQHIQFLKVRVFGRNSLVVCIYYLIV